MIVLGVSVLLLLGLHRENPKISKRGDSRYSTGDLVEFYIEDIGGERIKPKEPSGSLLKIKDDPEYPKKPYIVKILSVGGFPPLKKNLDRKWDIVTTDGLKEGDVVEMLTYEEKKEKRVYYIVQDGIFFAYLKWYL